MSQVRPGFFRGGELRGLIIFAVVMAVGWPIILSYGRPRVEPEKPKAVDNRPLEPDTGVAFQGLRDKQPMGFRDNAAYALLLKRARESPADKLDRDARRDVFYTHLYERPDLYRGVPIHLEGTLLRGLFHEKVNPALATGAKLAEAWVVTPESRNPYVITVEEPPPGFAAGHDLNERVIIDAYFLRLFTYQAQDGLRFAPLLVGRLRWTNADPKTGVPAGEANAGKTTWTVPIAAIVVSLIVYVSLRLAFQFRRAVATPARPHSLLSANRPAEDIDPEALNSFLSSMPAEDAEPDERPHP